jgi:hypothetical protein
VRSIRLKGKFGRIFFSRQKEKDLLGFDDLADFEENQWLVRPNL